MELSDKEGLALYSTPNNSETKNRPVKFEKVALACRVKIRLFCATPSHSLETYLLPSPPHVLCISLTILGFYLDSNIVEYSSHPFRTDL